MNLKAYIRFIILLSFLLLPSAYAKRVTKKIVLNTLSLKTQTIFLTKFDIGIGQGTISATYKLSNKAAIRDLRQFDMKFGIVNDEKYHEFRNFQMCQQKQSLYSQMATINWTQSHRGDVKFIIQQKQRQHIWYLYLFACQTEKLANRKVLDSKIDVQIVMLNNGSQFGQDQNFLVPYLIMVFLWVAFLVQFGKPILKSLRHDKPQWTRVLIYSGMILLGLAYFYRFLDLLLISNSGRGYGFLYILYVIIKNIVEGILVTLIISIAWGWSLTHLQHDQTYIIIGTLAAIANIVSLIISNAAQQLEESHHQYDGNLGIFILFLRLFLFVLFIVGIFRSLAESAGKLKHFLVNFGKMGSIYLLSWPVAVIFSEILLPSYMHEEAITFVEEVSHLIANGLICRIYTLPDSSYRKVNVKDNDEVFPSFSKK